MPPARTWPSTATITGRGDSTIARSNVAISRDRWAVASAGSALAADPSDKVGARAEGVPGVAEHDDPHRGIVRRVAQALMQLADQGRRQRVAVVRRIQRQPRYLPVDGVLDESVHQ